MQEATNVRGHQCERPPMREQIARRYTRGIYWLIWLLGSGPTPWTKVRQPLKSCGFAETLPHYIGRYRWVISESWRS
jgi:hypothetical protein